MAGGSTDEVEVLRDYAIFMWTEGRLRSWTRAEDQAYTADESAPPIFPFYPPKIRISENSRKERDRGKGGSRTKASECRMHAILGECDHTAVGTTMDDRAAGGPPIYS